VCCELALKSVGEQNTHGGRGGAAAGTFWEPPAREKLKKQHFVGGGLMALLGIDMEGGDLAAGVCPLLANC
jgi:hypothetical protein